MQLQTVFKQRFEKKTRMTTNKNRKVKIVLLWSSKNFYTTMLKNRKLSIHNTLHLIHTFSTLPDVFQVKKVSILRKHTLQHDI